MTTDKKDSVVKQLNDLAARVETLEFQLQNNDVDTGSMAGTDNNGEMYPPTQPEDQTFNFPGYYSQTPQGQQFQNFQTLQALANFLAAQQAQQQLLSTGGSADFNQAGALDAFQGTGDDGANGNGQAINPLAIAQALGLGTLAYQGGKYSSVLVVHSASSGTWNVPSAITMIGLCIVGGGGSGGGGGTANQSIGAAVVSGGGGGGGAGGTIIANLQVIPGESLSYVIGAVVTGGTAGNNGQQGVSTTVTWRGKTFTAIGGNGGLTWNNVTGPLGGLGGAGITPAGIPAFMLSGSNGSAPAISTTASAVIAGTLAMTSLVYYGGNRGFGTGLPGGPVVGTGGDGGTTAIATGSSGIAGGIAFLY